MQERPLHVWTPHMFGCPPVCLDAPICLDRPTYVWMPPLCFDDVWMPPVHTQPKESMLCQTKGGVHMPQYIWMSPYIFGCPCMFGCPLYVWMMFGSLLYIYNTKKPCFVRLRVYPMPPYICMAPYVWMPPCMFGCPLYALMPTYVWMPLV